MISLGMIVHHKPTLIIQDQSLYSWQNKRQSHQAINQSSHRKPPKNHKSSLAMQDQSWAQTPHSLPGRIKEEMCKDRTNVDEKVM